MKTETAKTTSHAATPEPNAVYWSPKFIAERWGGKEIPKSQLMNLVAGAVEEALRQRHGSHSALVAALEAVLAISMTILDGGDMDKLDDWEKTARQALADAKKG